MQLQIVLRKRFYMHGAAHGEDICLGEGKQIPAVLRDQISFDEDLAGAEFFQIVEEDDVGALARGQAAPVFKFVAFRRIQRCMQTAMTGSMPAFTSFLRWLSIWPSWKMVFGCRSSEHSRQRL